MFVRCILDVTGLPRHEQQPSIELSPGGGLPTILLELPNGPKGTPEDKGRITAVIEVTVPPEIAAEFAEASGLKLPSRAQELLETTYGKLSEVLRRSVRLLMWRHGISEDRNLFVLRDGAWSADSRQWHPIPGLIRGVMIFGLPRSKFPISPEVQEDVVRRLVAEEDEPLARQILREAWSLWNDSPKSALFLGIAAAEVGFKRCVATLVPDASWLVSKLQSPPLVKMLREYLPQLPIRAWPTARRGVLPKRLLRELHRGTEWRNTAIHTGEAGFTVEKLTEVLRTVSDVLWALDISVGERWAAQHIRSEVLAEWRREHE
jgi:hypothetical protein